ncbi:MAG: NADH-quinone oxidoreductase subunit H [Phycisphaerales bacterium]
MNDFLTDLIDGQFLVSALVLAIGAHVVLGLGGLSVWIERKLSAYIQDRIGPNRAGFDFGLPFLSFLKGMLGLGQALADGIKFFTKEDYMPTNVDKVLFTLAPVMAVVPALLGFVILPWGGYWAMPEFTIPFIDLTVGGENVTIAGADVSVGVIYILTVASVGAYGITIGGWASNNKYSMLGGLRATAQMISYEIPMGLALLCALLIAGSFMPNEIIMHQREHGWLIWSLPLPAILFYICLLAEANRAPFDNAEAEQELVGGYHTEYSSMRYALYPLAEYAHLVTGSAFFALLFLGGYDLPLVGALSAEATGPIAVLLKIGVFLSKTMLLVCFAMVIRWTIPRVRYDQVMMLGWGAMIPAGLLMIVVTSIMVHMGWTSVLPMMGANAFMLVVIMIGRKVLEGWFGRSVVNHKIPLYGSRYSPVEGSLVETAPQNPIALQDSPG